MKEKLPKPHKNAIIYEDTKLYACLANYPISKGHTVIVWKKKIKDLRLLPRKDYLYLMDIVDKVRNAMLKALRVKKVYLVYADEINQVHWHLVPRYRKQGFDLLTKKPGKLKDFSIDDKIRKKL